VLEEEPEVEEAVSEEVAELDMTDDATLLTGRVVLLRWMAELTLLGAPVITETTELTTMKVKKKINIYARSSCSFWYATHFFSDTLP
jgi:hypothetical protein